MRQTFLQGTLILLVAGVVSRLLGFVPRIVLPRWIGAEGIGLYQMGYPAMLVLMTLLSGGLPLAVAKMTAEAQAGEDKRVFHYAMWMTMAFGGVLVLGAIALAPWIVATLFPDERVRPVFLMMCPIVLVIGIASIYRGYYQGKHDMMPTAVSQVVESVIRSVAILGLAMYLLPRGIEYAAAGAMAGVLCGEIAGLLILMNWRSQAGPSPMKADSSPQSEGVPAHAKMKADSSLAGRRATVSTLLKLSLPVTGSRLIGSFSHWLESLVIVRSLAVAGVSVGAATAQYGLLAGMVIPTLLMPGAITFSLAVSLVPALAEAAARGDHATIRKRMGQSIRVSLITGGPFAVVMFVLAEPLCRLLYANVEAAPMLQLMSVVSLFLYVQTPLQSALQALDRPMSALLNSLAGAIVKLTLIYYLITRLSLGITGAAIAISVYITFVTILHWRSVASITQLKFPLADLLKLTFGMGAMGITCHTAYQLTPFNELFRFLTSITSGTVVFFIIMLATKMLDRNDITRFFPSRR